MTKSPVSTWGAKIGLCLPRSRFATCTARRPRRTSVASMTCHSRVMSPGSVVVPHLLTNTARDTTWRGRRRVCGRSDGGTARGRRRDRQDYRSGAGTVKTGDRGPPAGDLFHPGNRLSRAATGEEPRENLATRAPSHGPPARRTPPMNPRGADVTETGDSLTVRDNRTGKEYQIPITDGTIKAAD